MAERLVGLPRERDVLRLAERLKTSERRILGWEPQERHEHYDIVDGEPVLTGVTIVTREPEWDDLTRTRHLALAEYDAGVHDVCGLHESIASTDPRWLLETRTCPVCADMEAALRARDEIEREEEKDYPESERRLSDGRTTSLRLRTPVELAQLAKT